MQPGLVERMEFEYMRHGTQTVIAHVEGATGQVMASSVGPTSTEEDCVGHSERTIARDPEAAWVFVADRLNTHPSESLVRLVARACGIEDE